MASAEEDFPRGGTAKTTQVTKPEKSRVEVDNLFETRVPEVKKKRKSTNQDEEQDAKKVKSKEAASLKLNAASKVDILHLKDLKVGTLLLGCIKEVNDFEIVVGLPSGLTGYLPVTNISESYNKILSDQLDSGELVEDFVPLPHLFSPGCVVRCVVSSLVESKDGNVSLKVSINPKDVNKALTSGSLKAGMTISGCVESIEDHGFLIDIGLSETKAFLPKASAKASKQDLKPGQYVDCLLEDVKSEGRLVRLSVDPSAISEAVADTEHGWTLSNLCPGLLVNATVKTVTAHGLILEFLASFSGLVDFMHIDPDKDSYKKGEEVVARVLYVDPSDRKVALSLRSHLLPPGGSVLDCVQSERVGEVLQGCKVAAVHYHSGAILELPDGTKAFGHRNQLKEPNEPFEPSHLQAKPELTCRITDYSPLEQLHLISLRKSTIEAPFFRYSDLKPGQIVQGTILSLQRFGLIVRVTGHIKGLVPRLHLADVAITNPEKKFTVGNKIKCRVLSVDGPARKLYLTRKKGMVDSTLPVFATYADARVGRIAHGFIVCVKEFGCIVRFYGDVKGLVPMRELSTEHVMVPQQHFYAGQVVKAKVLQCDQENEKLLLSFRAVLQGDTEGQEKPVKQIKPVYDFHVGKNVEARVVSKVPDGLNVAILPEETPGHLPTVHLSDHASNCQLLWEALQEGDIISDAVCLSRTKQNVILTKKPLLKACLEVGAAATEFSGLQLGLELTGWVKNIMAYGVFVEFPHGLYGLAPKAAMSDQFVSSTATVFQMGQTVRAKVTNLDEEKHRFLVCLKASELSSPDGEGQERLTRGLHERRVATEMITGRDGSDLLQQLSSLVVGSKLNLTVGEPQEDGSCSFSSDDLPTVSILASKHHVSGVELTSGQKVKAVVLHVNPTTPLVHISLLPALLGNRKTLESGSKHEAQIQHIEGDFAIVSLGDTGHVTVVLVTAHLNDTFGSETERPKPGDALKGTVVVTEPSSEVLGGLPLVTREAGGVSKWSATAIATSRRKRKVSEGRGSLHSFQCGDLVKAVVSSIKPMQVRLTLPGDVTGSAHVTEVLEDPKPGSFPTSSLKVGQQVEARVIGGRDIHSHKFLPISHPGFVCSQPVLSLLPRKLKEDVDPKDLETEAQLAELKPGQELICYASKFLPAIKCLEVAVTPKITGTVEVLAMTNNAKEARRPEKLVKVGQALKARVVSVSSQPKHLYLSLTGTHTLAPGSIVIAAVRKVTPHVGLALKLPFAASGTASLLDLSDSYAPNPLQQYHEDQLVRCCIVEVNKENKYHVSLRPARTHPGKKLPITDAEVLSIGDLKKSQVLRGYVATVGEKGIFVRLSRTITGRVEFKKATNYYVSDHSLYSKHIPQDTLLTVKVLSVNSENSHVELSTLPKDTGAADLLPESLHLPLRKRLEKKRKRKISESAAQAPAEVEKKKKKSNKKKKSKTEDTDSGVEVYFREEDTESSKKAPANVPEPQPSTGPARLQVSAGFSWDATLSSLRPATAAAHESSGEEEEEEQQVEKKAPKKTRKALEEESKREEAELRRQEVDLMDPAQRPQSSHAFERLLLASPDSSLVWLQYMAFHLQATEIEQARAVAERALKTISFREEQEKLNVWVALMNLENMYGTEESLQKVFERAVQYCEPMPVYLRLADIYAQSNKIKEAENMYKTMVKRFRQESAVWLSYGTYLVRQGQSDAANALLQRALKSLSSKEHVDLITKFARLEFQHGDKERGRSMFDKVLTSYPKRTDLWSVFIDLMIKHGNQQDVRELFDRVIHLSVAVKRIKFFFKRYLEYEKKNGTPETIQAVKQKALEYVENKGTVEAS